MSTCGNQIGFSGVTSGFNTTTTTTNGCTSDSVVTTVPSTARVTGTTGRQFLTVQVWDTIGCQEDNIVRMYNLDDCVFKDGKYYWSTINSNISEPGVGAGWTEGVTLCDLLRGAASGDGYTGDVTREIPKLGNFYTSSDEVELASSTVFQSFGLKTYTGADLTTMGMTPQHNAVQIRVDVSSSIRYDATAIDATELHVRAMYGSEPLQTISVRSKAVNGVVGRDKDSKSVYRTVKLDVNGNLVMDFQKKLSDVAGIQNSSVAVGTVHILGFTKAIWSTT